MQTKISLESLNEEKVLDLVFHKKCDVNLLSDICAQNGKKKSHKLSVQQKVMLYLFYLRHDLSHRAIAIMFDVCRTAVGVTIMEVESGLYPLNFV